MQHIKPAFRCVNHCTVLHTSANQVNTLCLHTLRLCHLPCSYPAHSVCLHTLSAHTGAPKGHMLISCELNLLQRKDNRSAQLTQKKVVCTHTLTQRLSHCTCSWRRIVPAAPSSPLPSLCVCLSLPLEESCFVVALFSPLRALAFRRSTPPFSHFDWFATFFPRRGVPLGCPNANTADRGLLTCRSTGPQKSLWVCERACEGWGELCAIHPFLLRPRMSVHFLLSGWIVGKITLV